ncbi:MAG: carbohydrate-binding protein, partial [Verrucomicrobia bacterium]|nr:carbohydrate-binding protein [Verrucomicrobiota bacterium]
MIKQLLSPAIALLSLASPVLAQNAFHVTYLWHMHQPIYYPYESANVTDSSGLFNFSIRGVHDARLGSYGEWPKNAVQQGTDIPHAGVQVSFSGSLMENMNNLYDTGWRDHYRYARNTLRTSLNNPRLDTVGIAYHHSLMPLTTKESMRMQIRLHKEAYFDNWASGGNYSKGFWPPECAFDVNMIPALVAEGLEWVIVDNGHFDRACQNYPWAPAASIRPNKSDQINPDPASIGSQWVQLNNVWAPTKVSAPWGYQPHRVQYVDPNSDPAHPVVQRIVAVPGARYEGNENGRGGYGAFKPQNVWGDKVSVNNNAAHPMLILCHSDGDNYGMLNADAYNGQHGNFLNMVRTNPDFEHTSVQDYLDLYPVPTNDIIQVEPGSWVGIDGGTPYFDKWRENNAVNGEHPDLWSWSVLVAAANRVITADSLENSYSMNDVRWGIGPDTAKAWHFFLQAETSCYWYWDFDRANPWDGNATRGCNFAVAEANKVIARHTGTDTVGPTIWPPQRDIYNPGGKSFNETALQSSDFTVSTFADDVSGIPSGSVKLYWRTDNDGINPLNEYDNELYAYNSAKTSAWSIATMTADWYPTVQGPKVPTPACRAMRYQGMVSGQNNVLIDYFVEATDTKGNVSRSDIKHVWVGDNTGGGGGGGGSLGNGVTLDPVNPVAGSPVKIKYNPVGRGLSSASPVYLHVGQNGWLTRVTPRPAMTLVNGVWEYTYTPTVGTTALNIVFTANPEATSNLAWDNNSGSNWNTSVTTSSTTEPPDRPLNPSVVALSHVSLSLDWEDAPRATGYTIYRNDVEIGTSSTSQLLDTGLNPETSYSYRVLATNTAGSSGLSDIFQGTTFFSHVETHGL